MTTNGKNLLCILFKTQQLSSLSRHRDSFTKFSPAPVSGLPGIIPYCLVCYAAWELWPQVQLLPAPTSSPPAMMPSR